MSSLSNLVAAMLVVESADGTNLRSEPGAIGPLQIHRAAVVDVNRFQGWNLRHSQMTNRELSKVVAASYMLGWAKRQRVPPTHQNLARIFNGGPTGWRESSTTRYWRRVNRLLATSTPNPTQR